MGFFSRIANLWNGFLSLWVSDMESRNPEAVYEAAINDKLKKHKELKKAVSGIVYLRNKLQAELEESEKELLQVAEQIPVAVEEGEDEVALVLIQKKEQLDTSIVELKSELDRVEAQADEAKSGLVAFQAEIEKLRREKEQMIAAKANAEARIEIQEQLSGLTMDDEMKALNGVRESISKLKAEADVNAEVADSGIDAKLSKIREKAASNSARAKLDEMKKQLAARKAASEASQAAGVKKTM